MKTRRPPGCQAGRSSTLIDAEVKLGDATLKSAFADSKSVTDENGMKATNEALVHADFAVVAVYSHSRSEGIGAVSEETTTLTAVK